MVLEGLHPFYDKRVADLLDFKIYLDISDEVKFAWKIQRDMKERGHSLESIKASIEARKPDFDAYIDPQKKAADVIIQVCARRAVLYYKVLPPAESAEFASFKRLARTLLHGPTGWPLVDGQKLRMQHQSKLSLAAPVCFYVPAATPVVLQRLRGFTRRQAVA